MIGASVTRNIRRTGIRASKGGKPNPDYPMDLYGVPTKERLAKAAGFYVVGDDQQGTRIYHFRDTPLNRLYSRMATADKSEASKRQLNLEQLALQKYRNHWYYAGLEASLSSVDPGRTYASDPSNFSGMAKSERQVTHRQACRNAYKAMEKALGKTETHKMFILLDNFVCYEHDRGIASGMSPYLFRKKIRSGAAFLARHWGL
jgi:hypothetical protein